MAKYDYGGGCPCGLQYECDPGCIHYVKKAACWCNCSEEETKSCQRWNCHFRNAEWKQKEKEQKMGVKELDTSFDFGFSAVSENDLDSIKELEKKASELESVKTTKEQEALIANEKVSKMYKAILPLLNNLQKDPEKSYIYWPERQQKIEQFKKVLLQIVND